VGCISSAALDGDKSNILCLEEGYHVRNNKNIPDTHTLREWAYQAGQISLRYFRSVTASVKQDASLLTKADLEIEHFLTEQIRSVYPDHLLIGEEGGGDRNTHSTAHIWTIDPVDGTTAFVKGLPEWGIAVGLLYQQQPVFGLFYMPLLDDMTCTADTGLYYKQNGQEHLLKQTVPSDWGQKGFLAVSSANTHRHFRIEVDRVRTVGSIGASLVYVARGIAVAAFIPKARLWDLAAGAAILSQAGGELRYLSGKCVDYRQLLNGCLAPEPVIAGHPRLLAELPKAILETFIVQ
jgi:myo-inositol-1(or 4)-monophosphatase